MTLRTLNYGNYGIFLIMGNAGFCPSTVLSRSFQACYDHEYRSLSVIGKITMNKSRLEYHQYCYGEVCHEA